jgi:hypothetical protein
VLRERGPNRRALEPDVVAQRDSLGLVWYVKTDEREIPDTSEIQKNDMLCQGVK